jgi:hypothetical protein
MLSVREFTEALAGGGHCLDIAARLVDEAEACAAVIDPQNRIVEVRVASRVPLADQ